jgi:hypothetical protein
VFSCGATLAVVAPGTIEATWSTADLGIGHVDTIVAWPFDEDSFALVDAIAGRVHRFRPATSELVETIELGSPGGTLASTPFGLVMTAPSGMPKRVLRPDGSITEIALPAEAREASVTYHGGRLLFHYAMGDHSEAVLYGCR